MKDELFLSRLGESISQIREDKGLTQIQLADLCELDRSIIHRLESGSANPTVVTLKKLGDAMKVNVGDFFKFESKKKK